MLIDLYKQQIAQIEASKYIRGLVVVMLQASTPEVREAAIAYLQDVLEKKAAAAKVVAEAGVNSDARAGIPVTRKRAKKTTAKKTTAKKTTAKKATRRSKP